MPSYSIVGSKSGVSVEVMACYMHGKSIHICKVAVTVFATGTYIFLTLTLTVESAALLSLTVSHRHQVTSDRY